MEGLKVKEEDVCSECGATFTSDNYITEPDGTEEYWGAIVQRPDIVVGYVCPECGHEGKF